MTPRIASEEPQRLGAVSAESDREDLCLAEAVGSGDESKFVQLYRKHVGWAHARVTRLVGPSSERDDLLQEIFLGLHRALPRFRGEARLTTLLHRIIVNVCYSYLATAWRRRSLPFSSAQLDELVEPSASPETRAEQRQQVAQALALLAEVRPKKRIAFVLVIIEGMSLAEAAVVVGAREDAVKQRVLQARRELEGKLAHRAQKEVSP